jgi:hypothetical protein
MSYGQIRIVRPHNLAAHNKRGSCRTLIAITHRKLGNRKVKKHRDVACDPSDTSSRQLDVGDKGRCKEWEFLILVVLNGKVVDL